jgi:hypothetical protein
MTLVRPYGIWKKRSELWTCDAKGNIGDNITQYVESMTAQYDWLGAVKGTLNVRLRDTSLARSLKTCLMPIVRMEWRDSTGKAYRIDEPIGVFHYLPPDQDIDETRTINNIVAYDGTWALGQLTADSLKVIGTGRPYGLEALRLLEGQAPMNLNIPNTGQTVVTPRTIRPNDSLYDWANDLMAAANYWDLAARRDGNVTSYQRTTLSDANPARVIDASLGDVIRTTVRKQPDRDGFCNQVYLASNNPEADITLRDGYKISYVDPNSPYSIRNTITISKAITDSRGESFDVLRQKAVMMLERSAGLLTRMTIDVLPNPEVIPREVWNISIKQRDANVVASGNYFVEQVHWGLTPGNVAQAATVSSLVPLAQLA